MREREEKVNLPREIPPTGEDYLSPQGWLTLPSLATRFLPLGSHRRVSHQLQFSMFEPAASKSRARLLENTLFYCYRQIQRIPASLLSKCLHEVE